MSLLWQSFLEFDVIQYHCLMDADYCGTIILLKIEWAYNLLWFLCWVICSLKASNHHVFDVHQSNHLLVLILKSWRKLWCKYLIFPARASILTLLLAWVFCLGVNYLLDTFRRGLRNVLLILGWGLCSLSYGHVFIEIIWFETVSIRVLLLCNLVLWYLNTSLLLWTLPSGLIFGNVDLVFVSNCVGLLHFLCNNLNKQIQQK